jgi:hypothetical protein
MKSGGLCFSSSPNIFFTAGATSREGSDYSSRTPEFHLYFCGVDVALSLDFLFSVYRSLFVFLSIVISALLFRDRLFNLQGGLWFFVSFRNFFSDNTRVRIFFFSRI